MHRPVCLNPLQNICRSDYKMIHTRLNFKCSRLWNCLRSTSLTKTSQVNGPSSWSSSNISSPKVTIILKVFAIVEIWMTAYLIGDFQRCRIVSGDTFCSNREYPFVSEIYRVPSSRLTVDYLQELMLANNVIFEEALGSTSVAGYTINMYNMYINSHIFNWHWSGVIVYN